MVICSAEIQIFDYTHSNMVAVNTGTATIQSGTFRIIHVIEISKYGEVLKQIKEHISQYINRTHILFPYLSREITLIKDNLHRLEIKHRNPRSINAIGTAWKWIAGNPDHDDFQILKDTMNKILRNENNQVIINKLTSEKIEELRTATNEIVKLVKSNVEIENELLLNYKFKLDVLEEELRNIEYAINWAKANVVNAHILNNEEINTIDKILTRNDIPFANIDEALEFSKVKIARNNETILYILSFPLSEEEKCTKLLVKPVKKGNLAIKVSYEKILKCKEKLFGMKNNCRTLNDISLCNVNDVIDLSNTKCIPNLLRSQKANCTTTNNQHMQSVDEFAPGLILLNQFRGDITIDNETTTLEDTFLIKFHNLSISIEGRKYEYHEITTFNPIPALLQPTSQEAKIEEVLSLQMIKELQYNNTVLINGIDDENRINLVTNLSFGSLLMITILCGLAKILMEKRTKFKISTKGKIENKTENSAQNEPRSLQPEQLDQILCQ